MYFMLGLLQIAFVVLKLIEKIDWGWGLVFIPVYAMLLIVFIISIIVGVIAFK